MQINSIYLYSNLFNVYFNPPSDGITERNEMPYNRDMIVQRNADNRIDFQVKSGDQKKVNISGSTLVFNLIDIHTEDLVFSKDLTADDASIGRMHFTFTRDDLEDLEEGFYRWSLMKESRTTIDGDEYTVDNRTPLYFDSRFSTTGNLEIRGTALGLPYDTIELEDFQLKETFDDEPDFYLSSIVDANVRTSNPASLHTFQIYTTDYTGEIEIQASTTEGSTPTQWTTLESFIPDVNMMYKNITGKYNFFRVKHTPLRTNQIAQFVVAQTILGGYTVSIKEDGRGYIVGDKIEISGRDLGGSDNNNDLTITVTEVGPEGELKRFTQTGTSYRGVRTFVVSGQITNIGSVDKILYR